jgi:extracellular factor (EF) 3-hydroxypalmitic acid methyl ester biosynthesis protein
MKGRDDDMHAVLAEGRSVLDRASACFEDDQVHLGMEELVLGLKVTRQRMSGNSWESFCRTECVGHPVRFMVHQDPLTERAYFKPRGYPGDAVLMDLFYGDERVKAFVDEATKLGREIYQKTSNGSAARSLRRRKEILAAMIDRVSSARSSAHVLTLGCGHLREAELSSAVKERRVERFVAFDRDPDTLRVVREKFGPLGIETAEGSVNELIENAGELGRFDFVYAAGPYDYLNRLTATRLTEALFRCTRPGGLLLVTNFVHGVRDAGYMEAFMDWRLQYRSAGEMYSLCATLPETEVADRRTFAEESGGIVFMAVRRR